MKTWDEKTKNHWINEMQAHQDADRLRQGCWWDEYADGEFRGCFFGCAMQTDHDPLEKASKAMHLPKWLVDEAENLFEHLPDDEASEFPVRLCKAIPCDADIDYIEDVFYSLASEDNAWSEETANLIHLLENA